MGNLLDLKEYFGCGNICIDNREQKAYKFVITKIDDIIIKVIPHLDQYPLITSKNLDYQDWKKAALMFKAKEHLKEEGLNTILLLKNNMNSLRAFEERWNFIENTISSIQLSNEWVQAFIDGEGCLYFGISNTTNRGKPYVALTATLEVAQSNHDVGVLNALKNFFEHGYLKPKYDIHNLDAVKNSRIVNRFVINQHELVIQFLDKFPLLTRKYLDYLDWKKLIQFKKDKVYNIPEGLKKMQDIKASMNKGRS